MRLAVFSLAVLGLAAAPALALQDTSDVSVGLSVRTVPGGSVALFNSPAEAQAACTGAGGGFGLRDGKWVCVRPRKPLRSTRTTTPDLPSGTPSSSAQVEPQDQPEVAVESRTLRPGESVSFVLAAGGSHQLLRRVAPSASGAITIRYEVAGSTSQVIASSKYGRQLTFRVLASPKNNGGFSPMGEISDGTSTTRSWPGSLGTISVGDFRPSPISPK